MGHVPNAGDLPVTWRKSSHSNPSGSCVEVACLPVSAIPQDESIAIRNSRNPSGPALIFTPEAMTAFLEAVKAGQYDDLTVYRSP